MLYDSTQESLKESDSDTESRWWCRGRRRDGVFPNPPLWHQDHFELKALRKQQVQPPSFFLKRGLSPAFRPPPKLTMKKTQAGTSMATAEALV